MNDIERRYTTTATPPRVTKRAEPDGTRTTRISGYAAVFYQAGDPGTEYPLIDGFVERINPDAFTRSLREDDVRALFNHNPSEILARRGNERNRPTGAPLPRPTNTLILSVDRIGLRYDIDLPDTDIGRRVATAIERRDVTGSSFSFQTIKQRIFETSKLTVRELREVKLLDIGPVTFPAYTSTSAAVGGNASPVGRFGRRRLTKRQKQREEDRITVTCDLAAVGLPTNDQEWRAVHWRF